MTWYDTVFMLPEIILSVGASLLLIAPVVGWRARERSAKWAMLILLAVTALSSCTVSPGWGSMPSAMR